MPDTDTSVEEFLEHFGVPGMKWGRRKDDSGGGSGGKVGPSRAEERVNKAKARVERVAAKQKASDDRDATILKARQDVAKTSSELRVAKVQYKVDKQTLGKTKAKEILGKAKDVHMTNVYNANLSTAKELTDQSNKEFWDAVDRYASS